MNSKSLSALGSPSVNNQPSVFSAHPFEKTVSSESADITRLIRSFHNLISLFVYAVI